MNTQVFGCPHCSQRFQVTEEQAGQIVQCPGCAQTVEIPNNAFSATATPTFGSAAPAPSPATESIVDCNYCQGQFRVPPELFGQQVACPHCQQTVDIGGAETDTGTSDAADEFPDFQINTEGRESRKSHRKSIANPDAIDSANEAKAEPLSAPPEKLINVRDNKRSNKRESQKNRPRVNKNSSPQDSSSSTDLLPPSIRAKSTSPTLPPDEMEQAATISGPVKTNGQPNESDSRSAIGIGLLPPRFEIDDPTRIRMKSVDEFKVYLPDAEGGTRQFDQRVLHVDHEGQKVSLIAQSPEEQRKRRLISNIISICIGILVLGLVFWLLTL